MLALLVLYFFLWILVRCVILCALYIGKYIYLLWHGNYELLFAYYIYQYCAIWQLNNTTRLQCRNTIVGNYRKGRSNTRLGWKNQLLPCKLLSDWVHNNDQAIIYQQNHSNNLDAKPKVSLRCNFIDCFCGEVSRATSCKSQ